MKGPKDGVVTACFKTAEPGMDLAGRTGILLVSVGQDYHEGDRLGATLDLVDRSGLRSLTIMLADTLQRYNGPADLPAVEAHRLALEKGDHWLERNDGPIRKLKVPVTLIRWDECLNDPRFPALHQAVIGAYETNAAYRQCIDATVYRFMERCARREGSGTPEQAFANCRRYLLEECPIIMPMWAQQGYDFIIYPLPMTQGMNATYDLFVRTRFPGKVQWLFLAFKRKCVGAAAEPMA
jgi:hypothetical protein